MSVNRAAEIEKILREASERYYTDGTSNLTDEEFDALRDELEQVDPMNGFLKQVGAKEKVLGWPKAKHTIPMGSLEKVRDSQELREWWCVRERELKK